MDATRGKKQQHCLMVAKFKKDFWLVDAALKLVNWNWQKKACRVLIQMDYSWWIVQGNRFLVWGAEINKGHGWRGWGGRVTRKLIQASEWWTMFSLWLVEGKRGKSWIFILEWNHSKLYLIFVFSFACGDTGDGEWWPHQCHAETNPHLRRNGSSHRSGDYQTPGESVMLP